MGYITGIAGTGTGGYFTDLNGVPRLLMADNPWALIPSAGRWGGTWQADLDAYCNSRGAQGFNAAYTDPLGNNVNYAPTAPFNDGRTWDGVWPFTVNGTAGSTTALAGTETIALNGPFWTRVDYFTAACARNGMTAWINCAYTEGSSGDLGAAGTTLGQMSAAQLTAYGTALAARYASTPNIIWTMGNDYSGPNLNPAAYDTKINAILTALRGGGDTHLFSLHAYPESDSRYDFGSATAGESSNVQAGQAHAQFSMVYTYIPTYYGVEYAYKESGAPVSSPAAIPVIWGDGYFYQNTGAAYNGTFDRAERQYAWWALTSGARGINTGSEGIWQWPSTAPAAVTGAYYYASVAGKIRALIESLPAWYRLVPDTSSKMVTAGRGTYATPVVSGGSGTQYGTATTDNYVTASRTPDGSLALIYLSHASAVTVDQGTLQPGYTASWVDPDSLAIYAGTPGGTYNSGAADGAKPVLNNRGDPDWVLVLQAPSPQRAVPARTIRGGTSRR